MKKLFVLTVIGAVLGVSACSGAPASSNDPGSTGVSYFQDPYDNCIRRTYGRDGYKGFATEAVVPCTEELLADIERGRWEES